MNPLISSSIAGIGGSISKNHQNVAKKSLARTLSSSSPLNACHNTLVKLKHKFGSSCGDTSDKSITPTKKINNDDIDHQFQQQQQYNILTLKPNHSSSCLHLYNQNQPTNYPNVNPVLSTFKTEPVCENSGKF